MGEVGRAGDDRTFRVNLAGDGTARLQEKVKEKLKEFMGDYTDDTLVEYVIVLIRNGRQKEEAKKELNVFLGDDSDSFVSWLWDHLYLNMNLYAQPKESLTEEVADRIVTTNNHFEKSNIEMAKATFAPHTDFEQVGQKSVINVSRSRRNREWKDVGAMNGGFPLRSTVIDALNSAENTSERVDVRRLSPPRPQVSRKRSREDGWPPKKKPSMKYKNDPFSNSYKSIYHYLNYIWIQKGLTTAGIIEDPMSSGRIWSSMQRLVEASNRIRLELTRKEVFDAFPEERSSRQ
ncbi:hypothetical protein KSP40_PGU014391 [Platanthera guangdongensis]|uniref:PWI domain-containing protein n=1 Tax=Platanthera guangdongensis TaxID=2320717 RepID=A0ABR2MJT7_9ASPA